MIESLLFLKILFWVLLSLIFYCYFGYPVLIYLWSVFLKKEVKKCAIEPTVSIIISAYNEEDCIEAKIKNLLTLNYPKSKIEIIVGSDGSTDKTDVVVSRYASSNLSFYVFEQRRGKMATLNDLVAKSQSEILVFNDARQSLDQNALRELVTNFCDSSVGCVSGELHFVPLQQAGGTAKGINLYWKYEKFLRACESQAYSMLGATGAIYAIRRNLFTQIPQNVVLDDMYVPLKIIQMGFRAIWDPAAKAYDKVADNPQEEHRRKVRTLYGNYQIFQLFLDLLNPLTSPIAVQLLSHKFLRIIMPFLLIGLFLVNFILAHTSFIFQLFLMGQIIFYLLAATGWYLRSNRNRLLTLFSKICYVPYVFCLLNFSALIGFFKFAKHQQSVTWEKARG